MIIKNLLLIGVLLNSLFSTTKLIDYYIQKTNQQFNQIEDYQVDMLIELDVPAFRMPKKKYKVFYKNPNKIKVKAKGFGMLPKTGIFTSPSDNFDNLKNLYVSDYHDADNVHNILLVGDLIVDSLKLEMPNEYSRITFDPIVEVRVDTMHWVITNVTTKLDTLKLFQISNEYDMFNDNFYMPKRSIVKYYVKDKKIFNWLNKDAGNMIGQDPNLTRETPIVEGTINVDYQKYIINKGIDDRLFEDK